MTETITYQPRWFHVGDADTVEFAIAYGIIALTTIWVLEHIFQRLLYSQSDGIRLSDAAALVTYSGSGPVHICRWLFAPKQRFCRRAFVATIFRLGLLVADVAIIFLFIPRSIPVLESDVLSTQLSFKANASRLKWEPGDSLFTTCKPDAIEYEGFSTSAVRQLCISTIVFSDPALANYSRFLNTHNSVEYLVHVPDNNEGLVIYSFHDSILYLLTLTLNFKDGLNSTLYTLHTPVDIAVQAASAMLQFPSMEQCQRNSEGYAIRLTCPKESVLLYDNFSTDMNVQLLYFDMGTEKASPRLRKVLRGTENAVMTFPIIGYINRPRLSIFPGLILVTSLLIVHALLRMVREGQDLEFKLWSFISGVLHSQKCGNPLESPCMKLSLDAESQIE